MSSWIECNLPWTFYGNGKNSPKLPSLNKEINKEFGTTQEKEYKELMTIFGNAKYGTAEYNKISKSKAYKAAHRKYQTICGKIREWTKRHPLWVKYQNDLETYYLEESLKSFCGRKLNQPGTIIEAKIGKELQQFLIGDINALGGVCDDCMGFPKETVILRYKVISGY